jgi:hypothetical protein
MDRLCVKSASDVGRHTHLAGLQYDNANAPRLGFLLFDDLVQPALRSVKDKRLDWTRST